MLSVHYSYNNCTLSPKWQILATFLPIMYTLYGTILFFIFYFFREFQLMTSALDNTFYYQIKTPISFWCRWRLNLKSLIQLSEILSID